MKCLSLVYPCPRSWRLAPRALRERLECSEAGTRDDGPTGPTVFPLFSKKPGRPFSSQPGSTARVIGGLGRKRQAKARDPERLVLDLIGDGHRFSDKITRHQKRPISTRAVRPPRAHRLWAVACRRSASLTARSTTSRSWRGDSGLESS